MDLLKADASNRVRFSKEALAVRAVRALFIDEEFAGRFVLALRLHACRNRGRKPDNGSEFPFDWFKSGHILTCGICNVLNAGELPHER